MDVYNFKIAIPGHEKRNADWLVLSNGLNDALKLVSAFFNGNDIEITDIQKLNTNPVICGRVPEAQIVKIECVNPVLARQRAS